MQLMYFFVLKFYIIEILNFHNNEKIKTLKLNIINYFDISIFYYPKIKTLFIIKY